MTLFNLMIYIGIAAILLTIFNQYLLKNVKNPLVSFFQNFTGALFVFSGWVKAIDPLGTAYKMEQYFGEFESTFSDTAFSFLSPIFPELAKLSIAFSVITIIFEIVLGVMLLLGSQLKFTKWAFFGMLLFFTFLTGFTYLTGYVPENSNFFRFSEWGPYVETNMKVTDCGCFGDFIKLEPKVSFFKDVFLLIPAFIFLFFSHKMHQNWNERTRKFVPVSLIPILSIYCFSNFLWDLPHIDFRPFKIGADIRTKKQQEREAVEAVKVIAYELKNNNTGEIITLPFDQFMKEFGNYPSTEWSYFQIKSEPAIPITKISDFEISSISGDNVTEEILNEEGYSFMVVAYKLKSTYSYFSDWSEKVVPLWQNAKKENIKFFAVTGFIDEDLLNSFKNKINADFPFYLADDILLKTIIRSNPGVILMKDGKIVHNWHISKLPDFITIKESNFINAK